MALRRDMYDKQREDERQAEVMLREDEGKRSVVAFAALGRGIRPRRDAGWGATARMGKTGGAATARMEMTGMTRVMVMVVLMVTAVMVTLLARSLGPLETEGSQSNMSANAMIMIAAAAIQFNRLARLPLNRQSSERLFLQLELCWIERVLRSDANGCQDRPTCVTENLEVEFEHRLTILPTPWASSDEAAIWTLTVETSPWHRQRQNTRMPVCLRAARDASRGFATRRQGASRARAEVVIEAERKRLLEEHARELKAFGGAGRGTRGGGGEAAARGTNPATVSWPSLMCERCPARSRLPEYPQYDDGVAGVGSHPPPRRPPEMRSRSHPS